MEVIEDFFKVFQANPHLFIQQTEFARRNSNLTHYVNEMRQAMANVRWLSVPGILWMEDAHLVAFSLMYDASVFVFDTVRRKWYVYGAHTKRHRFHGRPRNRV